MSERSDPSGTERASGRALATVGVVLLIVLSGCSMVPGLGGDAPADQPALDDAPAAGPDPGPADADAGGDDTSDGGSTDGGAGDAERYPPDGEPGAVDPFGLATTHRRLVHVADEYRLEQTHSVETPGWSRTVAFEYHASSDGWRATERTDDTTIEQWAGRETTVVRATEGETGERRVYRRGTDRGGETRPDVFQLNPLFESRLGDYVRASDLEYEETVEADGERLHRYRGPIADGDTLEARDLGSVRFAHGLASVEGGTVTLLVDDVGVVRTAEYEFDATIVRYTPDGPVERPGTVSGTIETTVRDVGAPAEPEFVSGTDPDDQIRFERAGTTESGEVIRLTSATTVPGASGTTNSKVMATVHFGDVTLVGEFYPSLDVTRGDSIYVAGRPSRDALVVSKTPETTASDTGDAVWVQFDVYLTGPNQPTVPAFRDRFYLA